MLQAGFEDLLKIAIGLNTPSIGRATIERAVRLRMATLGLNQADDYRQRLCGSDDELQELVETVVVPETWFFRDPEAFVTLVRLATERKRSTALAGALRLLSVPCSSGEEPYSMVMSLLDGGFSSQELQVDAMDISARALACATRGVYGPNSFRGASLAFRDRYFQPCGDNYVLVEWLRGTVTFLQSNVLSPALSSRRELYDVIFCRNLLIYFDRPTQEQVMKTLALLLKPDGVLFVGPAEAFVASCNGFTAVNQALSFAFKKTRKTLAVSHFSQPEPKKPAKKQSVARSRQMNPMEIRSVSAPVPPKPEPGDLVTARRLADAGRFGEAATWCETSLVQNGPSSEAYYLLGLVRDAIGDREGAAALYRKVIYLEPEHVEGLMHLALMTEKLGDMAAAERLLDRARRVERRAKEKVL